MSKLSKPLWDGRKSLRALLRPKIPSSEPDSLLTTSFVKNTVSRSGLPPPSSILPPKQTLQPYLRQTVPSEQIVPPCPLASPLRQTLYLQATLKQMRGSPDGLLSSLDPNNQTHCLTPLGLETLGLQRQESMVPKTLGVLVQMDRITSTPQKKRNLPAPKYGTIPGVPLHVRHRFLLR